jgi:magnesium chelatase family protein
MAIGLLIKSNQIVVDEIENFGFIGELSLNAELRPCSGVLPMVIAAKNNGVKNIVVSKDNLQEASLVKGINIFGFQNLPEVISFLDGTETYKQPTNIDGKQINERPNLLDFEDVKGQDAL